MTTEDEFPTTILIASEKQAISRSSRAAVDLGLRTSIGPVIACCLAEDQVAMRYALAAGIGQIVGIADLRPGVIFCGLGGGPFSDELFLAKLSTRLHAELILDVLSVQREKNDFQIIRDLGRGLRERLHLRHPVVLGVSDQTPIQNYVSRHRQKSVIIPQVPENEPNAILQSMLENQTADWQPIRQRPKTVQVAVKTKGSAKSRMEDAFGLSSLNRKSEPDDDNSQAADQHIISANPDMAADHLIRYLANGGFLDHRLFPIATSTAEGASSENQGHTAATVANSSGSLFGTNDDATVCLATLGVSAKISRGPRACPNDVSSNSDKMINRMSRRPRSYPTKF